MAEHQVLKAGEILHGKYLIRERLGHGASGTVYLAEHLVLSSEVAIKVLHPQFAENEMMRRRFLDEARTLARLRSDHSVRVLDADLSSAGVAFIAMEYVNGFDLESYIESNAPLEPRHAVNLARQICTALVEAHREGIVHRDIKPENVLLQGTGDSILAKVADYGLAKRVYLKPHRQSTSNEQPLGTPCYMAPEQVSAPGEVDHRADIFSVGVLLYEMCTGFLPFGGETIEATMQSVLTEDPIFATELDERIPPELSELMRRCMEKDVQQRIQTVTELREELGKIEELTQEGEEGDLASLVSEPRRERVSTAGHCAVELPPPAEAPRTQRSYLAVGAVLLTAVGLFALLISGNEVFEWGQRLRVKAETRAGLRLTESPLEDHAPQMEASALPSRLAPSLSAARAPLPDVVTNSEAVVDVQEQPKRRAVPSAPIPHTARTWTTRGTPVAPSTQAAHVASNRGDVAALGTLEAEQGPEETSSSSGGVADGTLGFGGSSGLDE